MVKIDQDGYKISGIFLALAVLIYVCYYFSELSVFLWAFWISCAILVFSICFFRDPERKGPEDKRAVVSAADGVVVDVSPVEAEGFEGGKALRIAVFMNIFNVHVNRSPLAGRIIKTEHRPGRKLSALNKRAEYENEYGDMDIETSAGLVRVRQIAGIIARRVVTRIKAGDIIERGDRIGIIKFGSRVDIFLPLSFKPVVAKGDRARAGETMIARPSDSEKKLGEKGSE